MGSGMRLSASMPQTAPGFLAAAAIRNPRIGSRVLRQSPAAGGIGDARGFVAALALGAEGVEMGTRFVATHECPAPDYFKQAIIEARGNRTMLLGKGAMPLRVLRNRAAEATSDPDKGRENGKIMAKGDQGYVQGDADTAILPSGQVAGLIRQMKGISEVFPDMVKEAQALSLQLYNFFNEEVAPYGASANRFQDS